MPKPFIFLPHMADIKIRVTAASMPKLFEGVTKAFASYVAGEQKLKSKTKKVIELSGSDTQSLMYAYLDELLYLLDAENFVTLSASVKVKGYTLKATLKGADSTKYHLNHIKAATYAEMRIEKEKKGWVADVVLDV